MRKIAHLEMKELKSIDDLVEAIKLYKQRTEGKGALIFFDTETNS